MTEEARNPCNSHLHGYDSHSASNLKIQTDVPANAPGRTEPQHGMGQKDHSMPCSTIPIHYAGCVTDIPEPAGCQICYLDLGYRMSFRLWVGRRKSLLMERINDVCGDVLDGIFGHFTWIGI